MQFILNGNIVPKRTLPIFQILRVMKLTALLITVATLQLSASGLHSQTISLSGKSISLQKVLSAIEKQSGYYFFYKYHEIERAKPVDVNLKDASLQQALKETFAGQPFAYSIEDKTIIVTKVGESAVKSIQTNELRGKVTDSNGE